MCDRHQITEARGGVARDTDRGLAGARPRSCHEPNPSSGSASPVPGHLPSEAGPEAFPDTPTSRLKGPARRVFPTSRQSGARRQVCTCAHKPALFFRESPEAREGFSSAMASPIFWKVLSFSPPPTLSVLPGFSDPLYSVRCIFTIFPENGIPPFYFWRPPHQPFAPGSPPLHLPHPASSGHSGRPCCSPLLSSYPHFHRFQT